MIKLKRNLNTSIISQYFDCILILIVIQLSYVRISLINHTENTTYENLLTSEAYKVYGGFTLPLNLE